MVLDMGPGPPVHQQRKPVGWHRGSGQAERWSGMDRANPWLLPRQCGVMARPCGTLYIGVSCLHSRRSRIRDPHRGATPAPLMQRCPACPVRTEAEDAVACGHLQHSIVQSAHFPTGHVRFSATEDPARPTGQRPGRLRHRSSRGSFAQIPRSTDTGWAIVAPSSRGLVASGAGPLGLPEQAAYRGANPAGRCRSRLGKFRTSP